MRPLVVFSKDFETITAFSQPASEALRPLLVFESPMRSDVSMPQSVNGFIFDASCFSSEKLLREAVLLVLNRFPSAFLVLIANSLSTADEAAAFELGFDHCFRKPLDPPLIHVRLKSLSARFDALNFRSESDKKIRRLKGLELDISGFTASHRGESLSLTPAEFILLELLTRTPGKPVRREALGTAIWGWDSDTYYGHIKCHVSRLRRKLTQAQCDTKIICIRGMGYAVS